MKSYQFSFPFLSFIAVFLAFVFVGCGMHEIESKWRDREVAIDGIDEGPEWENARYYFGDKKITIGLLNDESNLYIRLSSRDRNMQKQLLALGLTTWFDVKGGKKKTLGIHFPIGGQAGGIEMMRNMKERSRNEDPDQLQKMLEKSQKEIEIIGPGKNESNTMLLTDIIEL
ncbi:MAG: hypothetical protein HOC71_16455, partial [Candidatus Latescibacteria bacterium]|nr:hypothetical protein [Candidatus Latescibacterota bacterium]